MTDTAINRDTSAGQTACVVLLEQATVFDRHAQALMDSHDPHHVHRARVALRRLRSALRGFAPILHPTRGRKLDKSARRLFRLLGPQRDADVFAMHFDGAERDAHIAAADELRQTTRQNLTAADVADFLPALQQLLESGDLFSDDHRATRLRLAPVPVLAGRAVAEIWADVLAYGPDPAAWDAETRHEFRKDMKTLRYLSEFFAPLVPASKVKPFMSQMEQVQDALGELNDIEVARQGRDEADLPPDFAVRHDKALAKAQKIWTSLRKQGPWWV